MGFNIVYGSMGFWGFELGIRLLVRSNADLIVDCVKSETEFNLDGSMGLWGFDLIFGFGF